MSILVIGEHENRRIRASCLPTLGAASAIGGDVHLLIAGNGDLSAVAGAAARIQGIAKILVAESPVLEHGLAEPFARFIASLADGYSHILAAAGTFGKNIAPRIAAIKDVAPISDIIEVIAEDTFIRPIYAGNALVTLRSHDSLKVITVRGTAFPSPSCEGGNALIETVPTNGLQPGRSHFVSKQLSISSRPDLTAADIVVSGGRGLGSKENFALLDGLADKLGAAIGASRGAVDAGFASNDQQVGQTGQIVAPNLYLAIGISGAIQHVAGMKDSKVVVAINKDEEAPIFQIADYGLVADLFEALPELMAKLES